MREKHSHDNVMEAAGRFRFRARRCNGVIIAGIGLVRSTVSHRVTWTAELLIDVPPSDRPPPFTAPEHEFAALEEACRRLGVAVEPAL
jgi:hypothetical protein